jgi:hypothetical protein
MDRAITGNAGDPRAVKTAKRLQARREAFALDQLQATLKTPAGRAVIWDLLTRTGVFASIFRQSSEIYYLAGRQDVGHELLALCMQAGKDLYLLMETEARNRQERDDREIDATQTARADE